MSQNTSPNINAAWTPWIPRTSGVQEQHSDSIGGSPDSIIGSEEHGTSQRVLLIAEIANTHEGRVAYAMKMVVAAAEAGCGAVKFQKYYATEMLAPGHSMMATFTGWEWSPEEWRQLFEAARAVHLKIFVDVFGVEAYQSLAELPCVDGLKIHGADVGNIPLLDLLADTTCPILIGTGGCSDLDLYTAVSSVGRPERLVLMHGYQAFPCPLEDTALRRIPYLKDTFGLAVGLSEHLDAEDSFAKLVPLMAIPLGVCCIEKHITLDRSAHGIDHESSLNPDEMRQLAQWIHKAELAQGQTELPPSASEESYRRRFKKALITTKAISSGETISPQHLAFRMFENPSRHSLHQEEAVGQTARREIPEGTLLSGGDLKVNTGLCIVARLKSQRLPRKALIEIEGKPALAHLIERAKLCRSMERVVLCTSVDPEDAPLIELARGSGIHTYAGSTEQPLERLIACADMYGWQYVIRATGDNIFLDPELLEQAVELATEQNLDYVSMRTAPVGARCEVFSTFALRTVQSYADAPYTTEYLTWFVADNPNFRSMDLPLPAEMQRSYALTLDTPEDLQNIRDVVARLATVAQPYTLTDLYQAVESDPDLVRRCSMSPGVPPAPARVRFQFSAAATIRLSRATHTPKGR